MQEIRPAASWAPDKAADHRAHPRFGSVKSAWRMDAQIVVQGTEASWRVDLNGEMERGDVSVIATIRTSSAPPLYPKLSPGPRTMPLGEIEAIQCERLRGAVIHAVAIGGVSPVATRPTRIAVGRRGSGTKGTWAPGLRERRGLTPLLAAAPVKAGCVGWPSADPARAWVDRCGERRLEGLARPLDDLQLAGIV